MLKLIQDNITCLQQGKDLINSMTDDDYTEPNPKLESGSIGAHIRHNLDHYLCYLRQSPQAQVNYDDRSREEGIEKDRKVAAEHIDFIIQQISELSDTDLDQKIQVIMDCGSGDPENWCESTPRRELQFLASHTIHHYAIVKMLCLNRGIKTTSDFGVAPSTIKAMKSMNLSAGN